MKLSAPRRPNPQNDLNRKRAPRSVPRAVWATGKMRALTEKHARVDVSANVSAAVRVLKNLESMSDGELRSFLQANYGGTRDFFRRVYGSEMKDGVLTSLENIKLLVDSGAVNGRALRLVAADVAKSIAFEKQEAIARRTKRNLFSYLKERGVHLNQKFFDIAFAEFMRVNEIGLLETGKINTAAFERIYFTVAKSLRKQQHLDRRATNKLLSFALKGLGVSNKKIQVARRWIERNHSTYVRMFNDEMGKILNRLGSPKRQEVIGKTKVTAVAVNEALYGEMDALSRRLLEIEAKELREFVVSTMGETRKKNLLLNQSLQLQ